MKKVLVLILILAISGISGFAIAKSIPFQKAKEKVTGTPTPAAKDSKKVKSKIKKASKKEIKEKKGKKVKKADYKY